MSSEYVLGPFIASVVEPGAAPPPTPGRVGIAFGPTPTEPGGRVNVVLLAPVDPADLRPSFIHAIYVNPPDAVPTDGTATAAWFMQSTHPQGSVAVPQPPADASGVLSIVVPGVVPGIHYVQTVIEYAT